MELRDRKRVEADILARVNALHKEHREGLARLDEEWRQLHADMAEDCLRQYGAHEDDGGFMFGFCVRCGTCLG